VHVSTSFWSLLIDDVSQRNSKLSQWYQLMRYIATKLLPWNNCRPYQMRFCIMSKREAITPLVEANDLKPIKKDEDDRKTESVLRALRDRLILPIFSSVTPPSMSSLNPPQSTSAPSFASVKERHP
jgi:hypothetical protein